MNKNRFVVESKISHFNFKQVKLKCVHPEFLKFKDTPSCNYIHGVSV